MPEDIHAFENQFLLLSRELKQAEKTRTSGVGDEVDLSDHRRYVEALRYELETLKAANPQRRPDIAALEARAAEAMPADETADPVASRSGALAVIIGHSPQGDMGNNGLVPPFPAEPRTARSEYYWNRDVAERVKSLGIERGYDVEVFHRWKSGWRFIPDAYDPVQAWGPEASVEVHFNGSDPPARGTETLHLKGVSSSTKWVQTLQDKVVAVYGRKMSDRSDRGLKPRGAGDRGAISLRQIHPSALIEPFFGDSPSDAPLGVSMKQELAASIVDAFAAFSCHVPVSAAAPVADMSDDAVADAVTLMQRFDDLRKLYAGTPIDFPTLRDITFAQWAHESDFGRSELAREHQNFAGMKWLDVMAPLAKRSYTGRHTILTVATTADSTRSRNLLWAIGTGWTFRRYHTAAATAAGAVTPRRPTCSSISSAPSGHRARARTRRSTTATRRKSENDIAN